MTNPVLSEGYAMRVDKLTELSDKYLNDKAKEALKKRAMNTIVIEDDKIFRCVYFGSRVLLSNVETGVQKVTARINELADSGHIHSALTEGVIKFDLAKVAGEELSTVVLCYVLVPAELYLELEKEDKNVFTIGTVPNTDDDLKLKLIDGEFLFNPQIFVLYDANPDELEKELDRQINRVLSFLPPGTTLVSKTQCAMQTLAVPYEIRLYNPLLTEVKLVELNYVRQVTRIKTEVIEFNLLKSITYKDGDGKVLYENPNS